MPALTLTNCNFRKVLQSRIIFTANSAKNFVVAKENMHQFTHENVHKCSYQQNINVLIVKFNFQIQLKKHIFLPIA